MSTAGVPPVSSTGSADPDMGIQGSPEPGGPASSASPGSYDPLKLCVFATVALLGWVLGPFALLFFAGLGFTGYWQARRAGLTRSRCLLRDTRLVLLYLGLLTASAAVGIICAVQGWL